MKKLLAIMLIACVAFAGQAMAVENNYASDNVTILGPNMGEKGITPPTQIVKVRYAMQSANASKLTSGDAVAWDTTSADGVTVSACVTDGGSNFAGILVTDLLTRGVDTTPSNIDGNGRNWGYMAIQGYVLGKVDTTGASAGSGLIPNGSTLESSLASIPAGGVDPKSIDVGVLLAIPTSDTSLAPIWLE